MAGCNRLAERVGYIGCGRGLRCGMRLFSHAGFGGLFVLGGSDSECGDADWSGTVAGVVDAEDDVTG